MYNFRKEHKNAQWGQVFIDVGCLYLLQPTGIPCKLVDHRLTVYTVSVTISLSKMFSSSDECESEIKSNISSVTSQSVRFPLVAILVNTFQPNSSHTKPKTVIVIQASALPRLLHVIALT